MRWRNLGWTSTSVPIIASALLLSTTAHSITVQKSDLLKPTSIETLLPSYYKPDTDEICFRNGIRYVSCSPDEGRLVKLDSIDRINLLELLQKKHAAPNKIQSLVYVMLVDLDKELTAQSDDIAPATSMKEMVQDQWRSESGKDTHLTIKQGDVDPGVLGPAAARKLGAPAVTEEEERCYTHWLKVKDFSEADINTVLNELYVRHVAITQGKKKVWEMVTPTGCYQDPGTVTGQMGPKEYAGLLTSFYNGEGRFDGRPLQQRSLSPEQDKGVVGIADDMEVYHPTFGTHLHDPWFNKGAGGTEKSGHTTRSLGLHRQVEVHHQHAKRGGEGHGERHHKHAKKDVQPKPPTPPFHSSPEYASGIPIAPVDQYTGAGSDYAGHSGGSAISGKPHGFAAGVTGGGSTNPVVPRDIHELVKLLADPGPRVIHLDKVYDFTGSEGVCTNCAGCVTDSFLKCGTRGQLAINNGQGWCAGKAAHAVTYDKAGISPIEVGSDKSVIGITADAAIRGKGLRIAHKKNVILHNFKIHEINPSTIWGGDGITLYGTDLIWIDKMTFSKIGRQFIVTGYESAGRVTISRCFFDCATQWSATCDGSHYWTVLGYGVSDKVTFSGNLLKNCSGRSPRIANPTDKGGDSVWHVVNSVFDTSTGHSFDMGPGISVLIEGNVFSNVAQTSLHESSPGRAFAPADKAVCTQCKGPLGRDCQPNVYKNANPVPSTTSAGQVLKDIVAENMSGALPPGQVVASVGQTAGSSGRRGSVSPVARSVVVTNGGMSGDAQESGLSHPTSGGQQANGLPVVVPYIPDVGFGGSSPPASGQPQYQPAAAVGGGGGAGAQPRTEPKAASEAVNSAFDAEKKQQQQQQKAAQNQQKEQQQIEQQKQKKREQEEQRRKQIQQQKLQQQHPPQHY